MKLLLVGCGAMGSSLLQGWMNSSTSFERITVISPHLENAENFQNYSQVQFYHAIEEISDSNWDVILFAVKPKVLPLILKDYQKLISEKTIFISIAAALTLSSISEGLGAGACCARVMPNTPVIINKGVCGLLMEPNTSSQSRSVLEGLFAPLGDVIWVESDEVLDNITAISGCGPAYVFHMIEAISEAAQDLGFSADQALKLAKGTLWGASNYAHNTKTSPEDLRIAVTSPGGMTEAALEVLMGDFGLKSLIKGALKAALQRSEDIRTHGSKP
ncbi:Pyrroline-5-carboxylate reductase [Candidatus Bealeia paramacronuclearis]|uniref:Pyrroline-5-carboxylate reductase n=1 Tax=Candidatus Bealeia paramacronuclearis TaxID=1921001 RepID=A0ABZ2C3B7_9PROT|nr:Pyrroline-5-carboxylate reductase [Candidatus Bealeia paramacronuclearis]